MRVKKAVGIFVLIFVVGILASDSDATEKLDLKLRLKPGQKYGMRTIMEDKISQTIGGKQLNISHTKSTAVGFEVKEVDANGIALVKVTYRTLQEKTKMGTGGTVFEYDSTDPCTAVGNPLAPTYAALMGDGFIMKATPEGEIVGLDGIDEMFSRMAEKVVQAEDKMISSAPPGTCNIKNTGKSQEEMSVDERARKRIERINNQYGGREKRIEAVEKMIKNNPLFAEKQIRNMLGNMIMPFPSRPVGIGDSWTAKMISATQSLPIEMDRTYTVKGSKKGVVIVDVSSKRHLDDEAVLVGKVRMKLAGFYQGTSEIDGTSGWMIRKKANMRFSGEVTQQGMTVPISIESVITVEPIKVE